MQGGIPAPGEEETFQTIRPIHHYGKRLSLLPKIDYLVELVRTQRVYKESSVLVLMQIWLTGLTEDSLVSLYGFYLI